jgi:hypothetical protein
MQATRQYSPYSFLTSAVNEGECLASRAVRALPPVPIAKEAGWAPEPVGAQRLEKEILCFCRESNLGRPVVQSVFRHYTD